MVLWWGRLGKLGSAYTVDNSCGFRALGSSELKKSSPAGFYQQPIKTRIFVQGLHVDGALRGSYPIPVN